MKYHLGSEKLQVTLQQKQHLQIMSCQETALPTQTAQYIRPQRLIEEQAAHGL